MFMAALALIFLLIRLVLTIFIFWTTSRKLQQEILRMCYNFESIELGHNHLKIKIQIFQI